MFLPETLTLDEIARLFYQLDAYKNLLVLRASIAANISNEEAKAQMKKEVAAMRKLSRRKPKKKRKVTPKLLAHCARMREIADARKKYLKMVTTKIKLIEYQETS